MIEEIHVRTESHMLVHICITLISVLQILICVLLKLIYSVCISSFMITMIQCIN